MDKLAESGRREVEKFAANFNFAPACPPTELDGLVDRATDALRMAPDWAENLEIVDVIERGGEQAVADACRALRRRIADKNPKVALLALTLLETCMKNNSAPFHERVAMRDFQADLVRLATGKGQVAERALSLIQSWADAFQGGGPPEFQQTYRSLLAKGARFSQLDAGSAAPLFTPPPSAAASGAPAASSRPAGAADERERPVFAQDMRVAEAEQSVDKASNNKWTFGFLPGYSALPSNDNDSGDEDDGAGEPRRISLAEAAAEREGNQPFPSSAADAQRPPPPEPARAHIEALAAAPPPPEPRHLPLDRLDNIAVDLAEVDNNASLLRDCLSAVDPAAGALLEGDEMINELIETLHIVLPRVVVLIETGQIEDEGLMEELFRVHFNLQSVIELYDEKLAKVLAEDEGKGQDGVSAQRAAMPADLLDLTVDLSDEPPARSPQPQQQQPQPQQQGGVPLGSDLHELATVLGASSFEPNSFADHSFAPNEPAAVHARSQPAPATPPAALPEPATHSPASDIPLAHGSGFGTPPPASAAPLPPAYPPASQPPQPAAFNPFA